MIKKGLPLIKKYWRTSGKLFRGINLFFNFKQTQNAFLRYLPLLLYLFPLTRMSKNWWGLVVRDHRSATIGSQNTLTTGQIPTSDQGYLSFNIHHGTFKYNVGKPLKPCCI